MSAMGGTASKPRLLVLASTYPRWANDHEPGFVHELSRRLADAFQVTVLCPHAPGAMEEEVMDGVHVVRYRYAPTRFETLVHGGGIIANLRRQPWKWMLMPGFVLALAWKTWRLVASERPGVIHAHWLLPQGLVVAALRGISSRVPAFVVTSHGADLHALGGPVLGRLKRFAMGGASAATVVSTAMLDKARALGAPQRLHVIPMGVDLGGRFTPDPCQQRKPERLLFVGRLVPKKGLMHLFDALPLVIAERPGVVLDIAGFGPEETALREQARRLGIEANVCFLGPVQQTALPGLYRRASLFVAPFVRDAQGDQEGLPVALMEAVGCGCPAVVGDVAGLCDLLGDAADALCVDPRNHHALAAAILATLRNPEAAAQRAREVRETALGRVDWASIAKRYEALLLDCYGQ